MLRQVADANAIAEVAAALHISTAVKTHLRHIYGKLGVADRAAAVSRAYKTGVPVHLTWLGHRVLGEDGGGQCQPGDPQRSGLSPAQISNAAAPW